MRNEDTFSLSLACHTVDYDPFIKSQLASRNWLKGLMWCKFGHVTVELSSGDLDAEEAVEVPPLFCIRHQPNGTT